MDWQQDGRELKAWTETLYGGSHWSRKIVNTEYYFKSGLVYTLMARGALGTRELHDSIFNEKAPLLFLRHGTQHSINSIAGLCNGRVASYLLRVTTQSLEFHPTYVADLPLPIGSLDLLGHVAGACVAVKHWLVERDALERTFSRVLAELSGTGSLRSAWGRTHSESQAVEAVLHALEGECERLVCEAYELDEGDTQVAVDEAGTPAGWHPVVAGYDALPDVPDGIALPAELDKHLQVHDQVVLVPDTLARLKARLRALYQTGPGAKVDEDEGDRQAEQEGEDDEHDVALGARIPIPTETFLEELSQKLEIHPISVYWLLKEMREQEGLVSPPEVKRQMEDYVSVSILRLLGYRWPEQDKYEAEQGPILPPEMVDDDGIIPLVECGGQKTAEQRVIARLEHDFGEEGMVKSLSEFRQYVGRHPGDWLRRDFFKRHVQQFKQRPIAWHFISPERTFEAFVLYHKLSQATLQKLRAQYAGGLIERLKGEQERARQRGATAEVSKLQGQIEDVEEFRSRLEAIERGDELKYRIRCRWKGEEENGRPGPYAPDIDDGVKVNIRPLQEAGLLAVKEVIKKW